MNKLISFYNQNRRLIWIIVFGILLFIGVFTILKNITKVENERDLKMIQDIANQKNYDDYKENPDINVTISNEKVNENNTLIIDQFIRYCNAGQKENAYALLSNKCKEYLYPTLDSFNEDYLKSFFSSTQLYEKENYKGRTYKINLYDDIAATGKILTESYEEYYTIVDENDGSVKLNINNYIEDRKINKKSFTDKVQITVLSKAVFKDYEEYTFEVKNLTDKEIMLDSLENTRSMYLKGNGDLVYYSMLHENTSYSLIVLPSSTKKIKVKFSVHYNFNNNVYGIKFSDIILDNKLYEKTKNKKEFKDRQQLYVEI